MAHGGGGCRLRAEPGARPRGRRLHAPPSGAGSRRRATGHRGPRRPAGLIPNPQRGRPSPRRADRRRHPVPTEEDTMSTIGSTREHVIATYRKSARHYDLTSQLYFPQQIHRRRAVHALVLQPGDTVVEIACGTGLNFAMIEQEIGPEGRIVGVDLTDAMLA